MRAKGQVILIVVALVLGATGVSAQEQGKFTLYYNNALAGMETFTLTKAATGYVLNGASEAQIGPNNLKLEQFRLQTDAQFRPQECTAIALVGGSTQEVKIQFAGGKAAIEVVRDGLSTKREVEVNPEALVIFQPLPVFTLEVLARRVKLDATGAQEFSNFMQARMVTPLTARIVGPENVEFASRSAMLTHIKIDFIGPGGRPDAMDLWVDDGHRIIKMVSGGVEAYREGYERKK